MMVVEESSLNENSIKSMQEESHKTCKILLILNILQMSRKEGADTVGR